MGRKYEPTPPASMTSSWDNKPNYFPSRSSAHFSFLPKAETRPGSIIPTYGGEGRRSCLDRADRKSPLKSNKVLASSSVNDIRKSCLKTQSSDSLKSRSQSPSVVKFSPKNPSNVKARVDENSERDPPFEWIEFRRKDGKVVKGTVLPPITRD